MSSVLSGQPSVENGHSPDENQVSRTSGSCSIFLLPQDAQASGSATAFAVPDRNPVTPPQLATNAPIADVLHPVVVFLGEVLWDNTDAPIAHSLECRFGQGFHAHVPLIGDNRLHNR